MRKIAFLLNVLAVLALVLTACAPAATPTEAPPPEVEPTEAPEAPEEPEAPAVSENQAPMLAAMVEAGELPPLAERLPEDVQTIDVYESIGQYGGTWHTLASASENGNKKM